MEALTSAFGFVLLLLSAKVYATLAAPLTASNAAYAPAASKNPSEQSKVSNYFLHQPYGPNSYAYGYEIDDKASGNLQFRDERCYGNGSIEGSYGYLRPDGLIEVTRYRASEEQGYLSQRQTYAPGDKQAEAVWPTRRPDIIAKASAIAQPAENVTWDASRHMNVSLKAVANEVTQQLKEQHGLDLQHIDVAKDVLQPSILDVVNGKAPLKQQPNGSLAFETVHNLLPANFPIVPFELPAAGQKELETTTKGEPKSKEEVEEEEQATQSTTKAPPAAATLLTPKPLADAKIDANWYEKIIQANRREFLEQLPNLSQANV